MTSIPLDPACTVGLSADPDVLTTESPVIQPARRGSGRRPLPVQAGFRPVVPPPGAGAACKPRQARSLPSDPEATPSSSSPRLTNLRTVRQ